MTDRDQQAFDEWWVAQAEMMHFAVMDRFVRRIDAYLAKTK